MVALRNNPHPLAESAGEKIMAISLHQPWASAIKEGLKIHETRSWPTNYRGLLAIHAAKKIDLVYQQKFARQYPALRGSLSSGSMLCIVELLDCVPVEQIRGSLSAEELEFGDYRDGRFAWVLRLVEVFEQPIAARGQQGLFAWTRPVIPTPSPLPGDGYISLGRGVKPAAASTENHIVLADDMVIDAEALAGQRIVVVGQSGSGKTNTLTVIAEDWPGGYTIIDPMAQFTTLPGATVYGMGEGQTQMIDPATVAINSVQNGGRVVLDMSLYDEDKGFELLEAYLEALWTRIFRLSYPQPYALIIDEAYMYAPQVGKTPIKKLILDAARRGRHKRLMTVIASQRAATIDKNFFTQATMVISHRLVHSTDTAEIIRQSPMPPKEVITTMYDLSVGQALVAGDRALIGADYKVIQVRKSAYLRPANRKPYDAFSKLTVEGKDKDGKPVTRIFTHAMRDWFERTPPTKAEIGRLETSIRGFEAEITTMMGRLGKLRKKEEKREEDEWEVVGLESEIERTAHWIAAYKDRVRICREVGT